MFHVLKTGKGGHCVNTHVVCVLTLTVSVGNRCLKNECLRGTWKHVKQYFDVCECFPLFSLLQFKCFFQKDLRRNTKH